MTSRECPGTSRPPRRTPTHPDEAYGKAGSALPADTEAAVMALHSALRRRGIAAMDGDLPGSVCAEYAGRRVIVRHVDDQWWRPMPGEPHITIPIARTGDEYTLARDLVAELLGRL